MKIELSQKQIVGIFCRKVRDYAMGSKKGTYNSVDPTAYEEYQAHCWMYFGEGTEDEREEASTVHVKDITWGVEIKIVSKDREENAYFEWQDGEWCRESDGFKKFFMDILLNDIGERADYMDHEKSTEERLLDMEAYDR